MTIKLEVAKRNASAAATRAAGQIPGVVYGPKQEPISISVDANTFNKTLEEAGESTILSLQGLDADIEVLVHDVAFNAARGGIEHVDLYAIERGKELTTNVALEFVGEAPIEKTGATVTKVVHEIEVTCRPSKLPSHITVDVSSLIDEDSQIKLSDLSIPEGVTVSAEPETVIAAVSASRELEEEQSEEVDMDTVEVEAKGKEESEGEAPTEK